MKICFVADNLVGYHKYWAGAEQACYRQAKLLIEAGIEVVFLTKKPDISSPEEKLNVEGVSIIGGGIIGRKIKSFLRRFFPFDPVSAVSSYLALRRIKPDLVHLHLFNELSLSVIWSAKKLRIPVVFSMYDYWIVCPKGTLVNGKNENCTVFQGKECVNCFSEGNKVTNFLRKTGLLETAFKMRKSTLDRFLKKIDCFLVLSNSWTELLVKYGIDRSKIKIVPLPLPKRKDSEDFAVKDKTILFVGWVYPHKGLHILIKALSFVAKEIPDVKLQVVESGVNEDYKKGIEKDIQGCNIKGNVSFLGKLPNEKVQQLLQESKVVAVPEQWGIAWPIFLTEAMLSEKLIVASNIGDIPEFIEDGKNGFLAGHQDAKEFAEKIIRLLKENGTDNFGRLAREKIVSICNDDEILSRLKSAYYQSIKK
jgi:glycosyltransferase involved in cell wall biosynthesis